MKKLLLILLCLPLLFISCDDTQKNTTNSTENQKNKFSKLDSKDIKNVIKAELKIEEFIKSSEDDLNEEEINSNIEKSIIILKSRLYEFGVKKFNIRIENNKNITIELPKISDLVRLKKIIQSNTNLEFWETYDLGKIGGTDKSILTSSFEKANNFIVNSILSNSVDKKDSNLVSKQPLLSLIKQNQLNKTSQGPAIGYGPVVGYIEVKDTSKLREYLSSTKSFFPNRLFLTLSAKAYENWDYTDPKNGLFELIALKSDIDGNPAMKGDVVIDAMGEINGQYGGVSIQMDSRGTGQWRTLTKANIGNAIAIVLDGLVYSWPIVQDEIKLGRSYISGNFL